jgi:hypothetical protein
MAVWDDLTNYVGAQVGGVDEHFIRYHCWDPAVDLVDQFIGDVEGVPATIRTRSIMECGAELYNRRSAPGGIAQFASFDAAPLRIAKNSMVRAYDLLSPFVNQATGNLGFGK